MIKVEEKHGTIGYVIEVNKEALSYFSEPEQRKIIITTFQAAGDFWLEVWLEKRFSGYAYSLGYAVTQAWSKLKASALGQSIPFVGFTPSGGGLSKPPPRFRRSSKALQQNGEKMIVAATKASRAQGFAAGKSGGARVDILVPFGHPVRPEFAEVFSKVPVLELKSLAGEAARTMASLLNSGKATNSTNAGAPSRTLQGASVPVRPLGVQARKIA